MAECFFFLERSTNEVHDDQMKDDIGEYEIGERTLWWYSFEVASISWVRLHAKTN